MNNINDISSSYIENGFYLYEAQENHWFLDAKHDAINIASIGTWVDLSFKFNLKLN